MEHRTTHWASSDVETLESRTLLSMGNVLPVANTSAQEGCIGRPATDGTNFLVPIFGHGSNPTAVGAQLISKTGKKVGSPLWTGRSSAALHSDYAGETPQAVYTAGRYLLTWSSPGDSGDVFGQLISRSGAAIGSPFAIASAAQMQSLTAVAGDGKNFLVIWGDNSAGGSLRGRFVSTSGTLLGSELSIAPGSAQCREAAACFAGGQYAVAWMQKRTSSPEAYDIKIRGVSTKGVLTKTSTLSQSTSSRYNPLSIDSDGQKFLVVWNRYASGGAEWDIYGRLANLSGTPLGNQFVVAGGSASQMLPSMAYNGSTYVVTWSESATASSDMHIYGRNISRAGALSGNRFTINAASGSQVLSIIAWAGTSGIVVWNTGVVQHNDGSFLFGDVWCRSISA